MRVRRCALLLSLLAAAGLLRAQEPGAADARGQLALAADLYSQGQYLDAVKAFDAALRGGDSDLTRRARQGKIRAALRIAEFDTARQEAERLRLDADGDSDADARALYGDALWASGLFDEAERAYREALAREEASSRARFGIARTLASRNQLDAALTEVHAALALAPRDADVQALAATVAEGLRRFDAAAAAYDAYASLLPPAESLAIATARTRAVFLRTFERRVPFEIASGAPAYTVPFKLVRNKILLQGRLNGSHVEWVLDTGAERTGISNETAARAGVRPVATTLTAGVGPARLRRVRLARAETLEIGPLRMRHVPVSIRDPAAGGAPRWQGESLSPVALGLSVVVDYKQRRVTFARELPASAADVTLPLRVARVPLVRGTLNTVHPASFVVDTGGEVISISAETAQALGMSPSRRIPLRVFGLSGLDDSAFLLPGVDLDFDEIGYRKVGLAVLNLRAPSVLLGFQVGGIVGHKFLGDYRVTMDLVRSELRLEK